MTRENKEAAKHISMELTADGARVTSLSLSGNRLYLTIEAELAESQLKATDAAAAVPPPAAAAEHLPDVNAPAKRENRRLRSPTTSIVFRGDTAAKSGGHLGSPETGKAGGEHGDALGLLSGGSETLPPPAAAFPPASDKTGKSAPAAAGSVRSAAALHPAADPFLSAPSESPDSAGGHFRYQEPQRNISLGSERKTAPELPKPAPLSLEPPVPASPPDSSAPGTRQITGHFEVDPNLSPADTQPIEFKETHPEASNAAPPTAPSFEPVRELTDTWDETRSLRLGEAADQAVLKFAGKKEEGTLPLPPLPAAPEAIPEISLGTDTAVPGLSLAADPFTPAALSGPAAVKGEAPPVVKEVRLGDLAVDDDPSSAWKNIMPTTDAAGRGEPKPVTETWESSDFSIGLADQPEDKEPPAAEEESSAVGGERHGEPQPSISFGLDSAWTPPTASPLTAPAPAPAPPVHAAPAPFAPVQPGANLPGGGVPGLSIGVPAFESGPGLGFGLAEHSGLLKPAAPGGTLDSPLAAPGFMPGTPPPALGIGGGGAAAGTSGGSTLGGGKWEVSPPVLGPAAGKRDAAPPTPPSPPSSKWDAPAPAPKPAPAPVPSPASGKWDAPAPTAAPKPDAGKAESVKMAAPKVEAPRPEPVAEEAKDGPEGGGTTVLIRYTCPKCKTQGMQAVDKVGTVVNCSNCGKAMRLVMKK